MKFKLDFMVPNGFDATQLETLRAYGFHPTLMREAPGGERMAKGHPYYDKYTVAKVPGEDYAVDFDVTSLEDLLALSSDVKGHRILLSENRITVVNECPGCP